MFEHTPWDGINDAVFDSIPIIASDTMMVVKDVAVGVYDKAKLQTDTFRFLTLEAEDEIPRLVQETAQLHYPNSEVLWWWTRTEECEIGCLGAYLNETALRKRIGGRCGNQG